MTLVDRIPETAVRVCRTDEIEVERGVAALVHDRQVALFRLRDGSVHAVDHRDPATGANVIARGLLGTTADGEWFVASPLYKHRYSLLDGRCLTDTALSLAVHRVQVSAGVVKVALAPSS
ncbi:MAG TPA: nitrite reductase small subunit NirD [Acidimicrobiales bacterium]|nr:nitrite reductase small subunit NirD [Acidimicrobiales bacterium]